MGTKADPGEYDCYSKAESDEPMFVLLARDPLAPILVELWADMREIAAGKINKKSEESLRLAAEMRAWRWKKRQS